MLQKQKTNVFACTKLLSASFSYAVEWLCHKRKFPQEDASMNFMHLAHCNMVLHVAQCDGAQFKGNHQSQVIQDLGLVKQHPGSDET